MGRSPRLRATGGPVVATPESTVLTENEQLAGINADYTERYGFHDAENYLYKAEKGLTRQTVEMISDFKSEPQWMRAFRLKPPPTTSATSSAPPSAPSARGTTCRRT